MARKKNSTGKKNKRRMFCIVQYSNEQENGQ
jgi:hypothetical protein